MCLFGLARDPQERGVEIVSTDILRLMVTTIVVAMILHAPVSLADISESRDYGAFTNLLDSRGRCVVADPELHLKT